MCVFVGMCAYVSMCVYNLRLAKVREHKTKLTLERFLKHLLGRVEYITSVLMTDSKMPSTRKWVQPGQRLPFEGITEDWKEIRGPAYNLF